MLARSCTAFAFCLPSRGPYTDTWTVVRPCDTVADPSAEGCVLSCKSRDLSSYGRRASCRRPVKNSATAPVQDATCRPRSESQVGMSSCLSIDSEVSLSHVLRCQDAAKSSLLAIRVGINCGEKTENVIYRYHHRRQPSTALCSVLRDSGTLLGCSRAIVRTLQHGRTTSASDQTIQGSTRRPSS